MLLVKSLDLKKATLLLKSGALVYAELIYMLLKVHNLSSAIHAYWVTNWPENWWNLMMHRVLKLERRCRLFLTLTVASASLAGWVNPIAALRCRCAECT